MKNQKSEFTFVKITIIFLFGFLCANILGYFLVFGVENPFSESYNLSGDNAPHEIIKENQIEIYDEKVVINIKGASLGKYAATGSMKPVLDENSHGIRIVPDSEDGILVGDIITFQQNENLIIHRVIEKGKDNEGTYFITKGDNNNVTDGKIRFKDIKYITVAIIW